MQATPVVPSNSVAKKRMPDLNVAERDDCTKADVS